MVAVESIREKTNPQERFLSNLNFTKAKSIVNCIDGNKISIKSHYKVSKMLLRKQGVIWQITNEHIIQ